MSICRGRIALIQPLYPVLAAMFLMACAQLPMDGEILAVDPTSAALMPLVAFLSKAKNGEAQGLEDPRSRSQVWVIADRTYYAASGRFCRLFHVMSPKGYEGVTKGIACRDARGNWTMSESLINLDDMTAPRLGYP
jgi:hypothetical protein